MNFKNIKIIFFLAFALSSFRAFSDELQCRNNSVSIEFFSYERMLMTPGYSFLGGNLSGPRPFSRRSDLFLGDAGSYEIQYDIPVQFEAGQTVYAYWDGWSSGYYRGRILNLDAHCDLVEVAFEDGDIAWVPSNQVFSRLRDAVINPSEDLSLRIALNRGMEYVRVQFEDGQVEALNRNNGRTTRWQLAVNLRGHIYLISVNPFEGTRSTLVDNEDLTFNVEDYELYFF